IVFLSIRLPRRSTLFPYTTLFRSFAADADLLEIAERQDSEEGTSELPASQSVSSKQTAKQATRPTARNSAPENILREAGSSDVRSGEHTSELQSRGHLVCRLLLEK